MNHPTDDYRLLRQYVEHESQTAFTALVERYIDFVYSTCRRELGDPALAEDVTQVVFLLLARKAQSLGPSIVLAGWLFQTSVYASKNALRHEHRRLERERRAAEMMDETTDAGSEASWNELEPLLHDALATLSGSERDAIVLRYFVDRSYAETAALLGVSEPAARKRVERALDKLRRHFARHGLLVTLPVLATALVTNAVNAAPPHLLPASTALGIGGGDLAQALGTRVETLWHFLGKAALMSKLKLTAGMVAGSIVVSAGVISWPIAQAPSLPMAQAVAARPPQSTERTGDRSVSPARANSSRSSVSEARARIVPRAPVRAMGRANPLQEANVKADSNTTVRISSSHARGPLGRPAESVAPPVTKDAVGSHPSTVRLEKVAVAPAATPKAADSESQPNSPEATNPASVPIAPTQKVTAAALSPDGRLLATAAAPSFIPSPEGYTLRILDAGTGEVVRVLDPALQQVESLKFSPDGKTLAGTGFRRKGARFDELLLWRVADGALVSSPATAVPPAAVDPRTGLQSFVRLRVSGVSSDGRLVATSETRYREKKQALVIWKRSTGQLLRRIPVSAPISDSAFLPGGKMVAVLSNVWDRSSEKTTASQVELYDLGDGKLRRVALNWREPMSVTAISGDGSTVATLEVSPRPDGLPRRTRRLQFWDVATGKVRSGVDVGLQTFSRSAFSADGRRFVLGDLLGGIQVINVAGGHIAQSIEGCSCGMVRHLCLSDDGATLVTFDSATEGPAKLVRLDAPVTPPIVRIQSLAQLDQPISVNFDRRGEKVFGVSLPLRDIPEKPYLLKSSVEIVAWDAATQAITRWLVDTGHGIQSVKLSPDGDLLAVFFQDSNSDGGMAEPVGEAGQRLSPENSSSLTRGVAVYRVATATLLYALAVSGTRTINMEFSLDSQLLAVSGATRSSATDLLDAATGERLRQFQTEYDGGGPIAFSGNAELIALAGPRAVIGVYDTKTASLKESFEFAPVLDQEVYGFDGPEVGSLALDAEGRLLAAAGRAFGRSRVKAWGLGGSNRHLTSQRGGDSQRIAGFNSAGDLLVVTTRNVHDGPCTLQWYSTTGQNRPEIRSDCSFYHAAVSLDGRIAIANFAGLKLCEFPVAEDGRRRRLTLGSRERLVAGE